MHHAPSKRKSKPIRLTLFRATDGSNLAKSFSTRPDGAIQKTSHAQLSQGIAWTKYLPQGLRDLPTLIDDLEPTDCIATGIFDQEKVRVVPQGSTIVSTDKLPILHRTKGAMKQPSSGLVPFDHDLSPNMPAALQCSSPKELMEKVCSAVPGLRGVPWVGRGSSSQGIYNKKTGQPYFSSGGIHVYLATNITDLDALRQNLESALWRAGLGYIEFAKNGRRLPRTIIDLSVLSPERLIFEAAPILGAGVGRHEPEWESSDD